MRRRTFSYPLSLAVVIAALVAGAGGWVAWWNYRAGLDNTRDLANTLFAQVGQQTADATGAFLSHAPPAAEALRNLAAADPGASSDVRARRLLDILRANPSFTWVSYSDASGAFVGAYRPTPTTLRINRSSIGADGKTTLDEHDVLADGSWTLARHADDTKYDPRTRPFYQLAMHAGGRGVWTPPYVFAGQNVPGITFALPAPAGVFTIDFDLARLSQLVRSLAPSEHGRVAIVADDNSVVAHPTAALATGDKLVTLADIADPTLRAVTTNTTIDTLATTVQLPLPASTGRWRVMVYAPDSDFTAALRGRVVSSLLISLASVVIGVLIAWLLARRISVPLTQLAVDMAHVGNFELDDRPETASVFREIEMMNSSLTRMKGGLRSFARYVPRDLVRAVIASGREATLSGEVRELTVFFSDLAGFTTLSETKSPDELVRFLGQYFEDMSRLIASERGTVDKYLGDGIMAFWGAPETLPDHAARACAAALRCQRHLASTGMKDLTTRIGLATGEVLVGNIGSPERLNYTVMGDTANLASRLEGLNKQYGTRLMISEATFEAAKRAIVARPIDLVAVKGKQRGVRVYELLALADDRDRDAEALAADATVALDAYCARDFAAAIAAWAKVLARRPGDRPAQIMTERATELLARPPDDRWSAVMIATEK